MQPQPHAGPTQVQQQTAQLRSIKRTWKQYGRRFGDWWTHIDKEERLKFLQEWCPYMPLSRDKPYCFADGKKEDLHGAALMTPEWNQEEVVQGKYLIDLLRSMAEIPEDGEPGSSPGHSAYEELCLRNIELAHTLVLGVKSSLPPFVQKAGIVLLMPGPNFGQELVAKKMVQDIRDWLSKGMAVKATVFEALMLRLGILLGQAAACLDHFRVEIVGKAFYSAIGPNLGCAQCGAIEFKGTSGGPLQTCVACGIVFYCSKECQRAHWREHKPDCKPKQQKQQAAGDCSRVSPAAGSSSEAVRPAAAATDTPSCAEDSTQLSGDSCAV